MKKPIVQPPAHIHGFYEFNRIFKQHVVRATSYNSPGFNVAISVLRYHSILWMVVIEELFRLGKRMMGVYIWSDNQESTVKCVVAEKWSFKNGRTRVL